MRVALKIAYPIIITGLFIIVVFISVYSDVLNPNFYIVLIPLTAFLFLFGFATGQKFAFPVKKLLKEADYLSKGNIKSRFYLRNKDELGDLARIFNKIAEELEENKYKVRTLDSRVRLRTKTLEEIIGILEQKVKNRTLEFEKVVRNLEKLQEQLRTKDKEISDLKKQTTKKKKSSKTSE